MLHLSMRLQCLLKKDCRHPEGIRNASDALKAAGITPTGSGLVTLSGEIGDEAFRRVFPGALPHANVTLTIPSELEHCIESISIAPPHLQLE
jgi:hypothetical protein